MDIDWQDISKKLGTRLSSTILELEQWKHVAEKLFEQHETLKREHEELKDKAEPQGPTND